MDVRIRLARHCWRHRFPLTAVALASTAVAVITAIVPVLQAAVVDDVIVAHRRSLWPPAAALTGAALVLCLGLLRPLKGLLLAAQFMNKASEARRDD